MIEGAKRRTEKLLLKIHSLTFPIGLTKHDLIDGKAIETLPPAIFACAAAFLGCRTRTEFIRGYDHESFGPLALHLDRLYEDTTRCLPLLPAEEAAYMEIPRVPEGVTRMPSQMRTNPELRIDDQV